MNTLPTTAFSKKHPFEHVPATTALMFSELATRHRVNVCFDGRLFGFIYGALDNDDTGMWYVHPIDPDQAPIRATVGKITVYLL